MSMFKEVISQDDIDSINEINKLKKDIMYYLDMDEFIKVMGDLIKKSKSFEFRSERDFRLINKEQPCFILKSSTLLNVEKSMIGDSNYLNNVTETISNSVSEEIISEMSNYLTKSLKDNDDINKLFIDIPEDIKSLYLTNIYTIRINPIDNIISILYFI